MLNTCSPDGVEGISGIVVSPSNPKVFSATDSLQAVWARPLTELPGVEMTSRTSLQVDLHG